MRSKEKNMTYNPYWTSWVEKNENGVKVKALDDGVRHVTAINAMKEKEREKLIKGYNDSWQVKITKHEHWE